MLQKITGTALLLSQPLHKVAATRQFEQLAAAKLDPHTLMQRAGLALARLGMALAPHARNIWIACGPGNNGGDGFEAAMHLQQSGKNVLVSWTGWPPGKTPAPDAEASHRRALAAGVKIGDQPPPEFDFCIDALLGIGANISAAPDPGRHGDTQIRQWLNLMQTSQKPRLCADLPSGLNADTGQAGFENTTQSAADQLGRTCATGVFTLSFLTLKPGLFTADGRDCAGEVWFDDLGVNPAEFANLAPSAWLLGTDRTAGYLRSGAAHSSHKGSFGDVAVLGGESTATSHMAGAALLAARAALHAGAGRVFVALLGDGSSGQTAIDMSQPELMFRSPEALDLKKQVLVCGCGGGSSIKKHLASVLANADRLVLDADALNAIAAETELQLLLKTRNTNRFCTVLTPHPLEAARLTGQTTVQVQADRLNTAQQLAALYHCTVVLKGSGTVIAAPGQSSCINSSGNALLATAGTGDVLAGMIGAWLASGCGAFEAACSAVLAHGLVAELWAEKRPHEALTASALAAFQHQS
ncbi:MAG: NAD(P)H-hydrate dehydratase [Pseudomonadota bacterium]